MDYFEHKNGAAHCEGVSLEKIAKEVMTPTYVYSKKTLKRHLEQFKQAFQDYPTLACFAVKANSNLSLLSEVFSQGFGADLVSIGELEKSLKAGVSPESVVFSGVGKERHEIKRALEASILAFNVESHFELAMIQEVASSMDKVATVNLRINPNIKAETNPKIATGMYSSKFGIPEGEANEMAAKILEMSHVRLIGIACHIGSQMTDLGPLREAAKRTADFAKNLMAKGHKLEVLDMGGGLGIRYEAEEPPSLAAYAATLIEEVKSTGLKLIVEPGRVIMGNVGVLLCRTIGVKSTPEKNFLVVDGAMNDLIRPSMYSSFHHILPVCASGKEEKLYDVVGPICESGDFLGKDRSLPSMGEGDYIMVKGAGAYGAVMASNYNSRLRVCEVLVDGDSYKVVRKRESLQALWELEE